MKVLCLIPLLMASFLASCAPKKEEQKKPAGQDLTNLPSSLTVESVSGLIDDYLLSRNKRWCVPTPGLVQLDEKVLYYESNPKNPQSVMSLNFKRLLEYMEGQQMIAVDKSVVTASGTAWTITFLPDFRRRFGVMTSAPIRGASLNTMCVSEVAVQGLVSSRIGTFQGYRWTDVKVRYGAREEQLPSFTKDALFRDFVGWNTPGARKPEDVEFGDARLELQDGKWYVMSFQ